jgi:hypothetical protein
VRVYALALTRRPLLRWFAFWGSSGAGNEVPYAFLRPRIVEGIVQVLWSASGGVMEKHPLSAGGPFENANKSRPHPHGRVESRPNWFAHPERLSHCSEIGWSKLGVAERHALGCPSGQGSRVSAALVLSHQLFPKAGSRRRGSLRRASVPGQKLREHERDGKKATDERDGDHEKYDNDQLAAHHRIAWSFEVTAPLWEIAQTLSAH